MRYYLIVWLFLFPVLLSAKTIVSAPLGPNDLKIRSKIKKSILKGEIYSSSQVESSKDKKLQKLDFFIAGLHEKNCNTALSKLSQYERYSEFLGFVKKSQYHEKPKMIDLLLSHTLLPFDMILKFKIPRIKKPGVYPYTFDSGFLKGLRGEIHVSHFKKRCFFYTDAKWNGPYSGINDSVFQFFSKALSEIGMKRFFQISRTY